MVDADASWEARRDALAIRVLLATGLRVSSLVGLDAEDVDVGRGRVSAPAKGGRRITVALPRELGRALLERAGRGPVFASRSGHRLTARQVQLRFAAWVNAARVRPPPAPGPDRAGAPECGDDGEVRRRGVRSAHLDLFVQSRHERRYTWDPLPVTTTPNGSQPSGAVQAPDWSAHSVLAFWVSA